MCLLGRDRRFLPSLGAKRRLSAHSGEVQVSLIYNGLYNIEELIKVWLALDSILCRARPHHQQHLQRSFEVMAVQLMLLQSQTSQRRLLQKVRRI